MRLFYTINLHKHEGTATTNGNLEIFKTTGCHNESCAVKRKEFSFFFLYVNFIQ